MILKKPAALNCTEKLNSECRVRKYFKTFDKIRWVYFLGFWFFFVAAALIINEFVKSFQNFSIANENPWKIIDKWTYQSNVLLLIFTIFIVFFPDHQFLKNNKFLIATMVYIWFTFFGYNIVLSATSTQQNPVGWYRLIANRNSYDFAISAWHHVICPVLFIALGIFKMFWDQNSSLKSYWKTLLPGMIYPTIYLIYVATIPFVYPAVTDQTSSKRIIYTIYGNATNLVEHPLISGIAFATIYVVFFPASFAAIYYGYRKIQKHLRLKTSATKK